MPGRERGRHAGWGCNGLSPCKGWSHCTPVDRIVTYVSCCAHDHCLSIGCNPLGTTSHAGALTQARNPRRCMAENARRVHVHRVPARLRACLLIFLGSVYLTQKNELGSMEVRTRVCAPGKHWPVTGTLYCPCCPYPRCNSCNTRLRTPAVRVDAHALAVNRGTRSPTSWSSISQLHIKVSHIYEDTNV